MKSSLSLFRVAAASQTPPPLKSRQAASFFHLGYLSSDSSGPKFGATKIPPSHVFLHLWDVPPPKGVSVGKSELRGLRLLHRGRMVSRLTLKAHGRAYMLCKWTLSSDSIPSACVSVVILGCLFLSPVFCFRSWPQALLCGWGWPSILDPTASDLLSAGITGVYHHTCFMQYGSLNTGPSVCQASTLLYQLNEPNHLGLHKPRS